MHVHEHAHRYTSVHISRIIYTACIDVPRWYRPYPCVIKQRNMDNVSLIFRTRKLHSVRGFSSRWNQRVNPMKSHQTSISYGFPLVFLWISYTSHDFSTNPERSLRQAQFFELGCPNCRSLEMQAQTWWRAKVDVGVNVPQAQGVDNCEELLWQNLHCLILLWKRLIVYVYVYIYMYIYIYTHAHNLSTGKFACGLSHAYYHRTGSFFFLMPVQDWPEVVAPRWCLMAHKSHSVQYRYIIYYIHHDHKVCFTKLWPPSLPSLIWSHLHILVGCVSPEFAWFDWENFVASYRYMYIYIYDIYIYDIYIYDIYDIYMIYS